MHTVKNQYTVNLDGQIVHKPPHSPGRPHDYKMFQAKHPTMLPKGLQTFVDLGYEGMARGLSGVQSGASMQAQKRQKTDCKAKGVQQEPVQNQD